jgi:hypothetical protein
VHLRPISGARRFGGGRALRLASRGFGNRRIAFTPCRFAVRAPCAGRLARFRKSAAFHGRAIGRRRVRARFGTGGSALIAAVRPEGRLRRVGGAMLSSRAAPHPHPPPRIRIRRPVRIAAAPTRLAGARLPFLLPRTSARRWLDCFWFLVSSFWLVHRLVRCSLGGGGFLVSGFWFLVVGIVEFRCSRTSRRIGRVGQ